MQNINKKLKRILIVDDNIAIHEDLLNILKFRSNFKASQEIVDLENDLFADDKELDIIESNNEEEFLIDSAYQSNEAIKKVDDAAKEEYQYSIVFMDVRMPPGLGGIDTIKLIWEKYPKIEIVICTAYSDYSWDAIVEKLGISSHLIFMKKPFDNTSVKQTVYSVLKKQEEANFDASTLNILEDEIEDRSKELNLLSNKLDSIKQENLNERISKASGIKDLDEDMRISLNDILGITDVLLETDLNENQLNFTKSIRSSGEEIISILDGNTDFNDILEEDIELASIDFNIRILIESVIESISVWAWCKNIKIYSNIHSSLPVFINGDPEKIRQLLTQLLGNSIKNSSKGEIILSVNILKENRENTLDIGVLFEIIDSSLPISKEIIMQIENNQIDINNNEIKNHRSIGLLKSQKILNKMNSNLDILPLKEGNSFVFNIRFRDVPIVKPIKKDISFYEGITNKNILIVSNNPVSSKVLSLYINYWGGVCSIVNPSGNVLEKMDEAIEHLNPFSLLIVDYKELDLDNYLRLAKSIRSHSKFNDSVFISLISKAKRGDPALLQNAGYAAFLTKPIKQIDLYKCLVLVLKNRTDITSMPINEIITKHLIAEHYSNKYHILVVSNQSKSQKKVNRILSGAGISFDTANSNKEVKQALINSNYDLIMLELADKNLDSLSILNDCKKDKTNKNKLSIIGFVNEVPNFNSTEYISSGMDLLISSLDTKDVFVTALRDFLKMDRKS